MAKYLLLPEQLIYEGTITRDQIYSPRKATTREVLAVHSEAYFLKLKNLQMNRQEERATGFPLSSELVTRELEIAGGTIQAVDFALINGAAGNIAGGTHHAYRDRGEGFCLLNDIAISAAYAKTTYRLERIMVVDLDVHQGNGTAKIFENDPGVFTFSMHGLKNYPLRKEKSDLDISLPDGTGDDEYLQILEETLARIMDDVVPQLIFYQCGVDVLGTDKLGRLNLSLDGCKQRDRAVMLCAHKRQIPLVFTMGGGYSDKLATIVEAHANTFRIAREIFF